MPPTTSNLELSLQDTTLDNTIGAILLGLIGATFLDGFSTLQMYLYYHHLIKDSRRHKISVALLWVLDMFHLALTIHAVYTYIVTGWGNSMTLQHIIWSIKLQVAVNVVIVVIVQSLYASRVWILGGYHHGFLGYLAAAVVSGGFIIGAVLAYEVYTVDSYGELPSISWAIDASLATSTTIDFVIAVAMCYYLWMSQGNESRLNSRISRLMQYTLSSGLLTSACSLSALFTYVLLPNTLVFLGVQFLLTKLYVGSFFTMLNARERNQETNTSGSSAIPVFLPLHSPVPSPPWVSTRRISQYSALLPTFSKPPYRKVKKDEEDDALITRDTTSIHYDP